MKTLLTEGQLREGVSRMSLDINRTYGNEPLTIVGVMTGSVVLLADLIRQLAMPLRVGVVAASSYRGAATSPGSLFINSDVMPDITGRHVLLVDDIFDTGHTMVGLMDMMKQFNPASVRSAVLLRKRGRQRVSLEPDFVGFDIPDEFVVGYGLDYQDAYRNLPYVAALEPHEIASGPP
jgi:hypoxanthine phosphoribosyltransferase